MQRLQLYIEDNDGDYPLVDMFENETVQVTSTIQDVKDIGKVFTDFSMPFTVPASDTNNKIFRHFYNYNITGNSFDARQKKKAKIHINYAPFREGRIFLNGVKMRNNKAYAYQITFYGNTVSLKDLIGDFKLYDLSQETFFKEVEHNYDNSTVKGGFETGISYNGDSSALIYPLISAEKRLFYHSNADLDAGFFNTDGNLYVDGDSDNNGRGLQYTDLKPAVKCKYIIDAIEERFGITFTDDFFGFDAFSNLYMWLSRESGDIVDYFTDSKTGLTQKIVTQLVDFSPSGNDLLNVSQTNEPNVVDFTRTTVLCDITQDNSNNDSQYTVKIIDTLTGDLLSSNTSSGDTSTSFSFRNTSITEPREYSLQFLVETKNASETFTAEVTITTVETNVENPLTDTQVFNANSGGSITPELKILFNLHLPDIKIIDFLTGLFKMFNLTAYFIEDEGDQDYGKIYVDTLDNFYADALNNKLNGLIEIEKYTDASEHTVNSVLPFNRVDFSYNETDVILMSQHFAEFGEVFGNSEYIPEGVDFGRKYEINVPFSHLKYERLYDLYDESLTEIQWGYAAGGKFDAEESLTPPKGDYDPRALQALLFYGIRQTSISEPIAWRNSTDNVSSISNYWRPSNSSEEGSPSTAPSFSINFDTEVDEWQGKNYGVDETNSLYKVFYQNYVESAFNPLKRMFKVRAFLPPNIIINYRLNDQIKIGDKIFRINSITTDLMTGESELELLNIFSNEIIQ